MRMASARVVVCMLLLLLALLPLPVARGNFLGSLFRSSDKPSPQFAFSVQFSNLSSSLKDFVKAAALVQGTDSVLGHLSTFETFLPSLAKTVQEVSVPSLLIGQTVATVYLGYFVIYSFENNWSPEFNHCVMELQKLSNSIINLQNILQANDNWFADYDALDAQWVVVNGTISKYIGDCINRQSLFQNIKYIATGSGVGLVATCYFFPPVCTATGWHLAAYVGAGVFSVVNYFLADEQVAKLQSHIDHLAIDLNSIKEMAFHVNCNIYDYLDANLHALYRKTTFSTLGQQEGRTC